MTALQVRLFTILTALIASTASFAQTTCSTGYRVVALRYDAELRKTWETRQDCLHPQWPAYAVAVANSGLLTGKAISLPLAVLSNVRPLAVRAGENVRLWSQDASSRIEIRGIAEQSAHAGERINVSLTHQTEEAGLTVQHIAGIVRGANDVEIAQ